MKNVTLLLVLLSICRGLQAQSGTLDSTFAANGMLKTEVSLTGNDAVYGMVEQPDGKIVFAGYSEDGTNLNCFFYRIMPDGSPDLTFGNNGYFQMDAGLGANDRIFDLALQDDGKIVGAGMVNNGVDDDVLVVRLEANGDPDINFGSSGFVKLDFTSGGDEQAYALTVQPNGKIVIVGFQENQAQKDLLVARLNTNGTLDPGLDITGSVSFDIHGANDALEGVDIAPDGKIVAVGSTYDGQSTNVVILRLDTSGQPDLSFSTDGKFTADLQLTETDFAMDCEVYPDGKIIVAGYVTTGGNSNGMLLRLKENGILDGTFGVNGKTTFDVSLGNLDRFSQVALVENNKIVAGGYTNLAGTANDFLVVRTESDGTQDTSFNHSGWATFDAGGTTTDGMRSMAIQADGNILLGGFSDDQAVVMRIRDEVVIPQSISNATESSVGITAWPVPCTGQLFVELPAGVSVSSTWEMISVDGRRMATGAFENGFAGQVSSIEFNKFAMTPGVYMLRILSDGKAWTRKIILQSF